MDIQMLQSISVKTGLKVNTCQNLLEQGWRYVEELDKPARWVSPESSLMRRARV